MQKSKINTTNLPVGTMRLIGLSLLLMAVLAGFAYGYVIQQIWNPLAIATSFQKVKDNKELFLLGLSSFWVVAFLDLMLSWWFYSLIAPKAYIQGIWASLLRIIYTAFFIVGLVQLSGIPLLNATETELAGTYFKRFDSYWQLGLIVFGFHLIMLGIALKTAKYIKRWLMVLLVFAGICYIGTSLANLSEWTQNAIVQTVAAWLSLPMAAAELSLAIYFLVKVRKG